mmetsp:Transcript_366/g.766  ORF Transcript_366/g.766 Transcript_366/m.766 type:complete len:204 (-) Transcript_366:65-676(-)
MFISEVKSAAKVRVFAVVAHNAVGKHATIPVGHDDAALDAGHNAHFVNDGVADLLRHNHNGVVGADHEGGLVLLVITHGRPPLIELHGVSDVEFKPLVSVGELAVVDKIFVDVYSDARRACSFEETNHFAGAAADLDHNVVGVLVAGLDNTTARVMVEVVEDGVLVADGVFPRVDCEVCPELGFVVEVIDADGCVGRHDCLWC